MRKKTVKKLKYSNIILASLITILIILLIITSIMVIKLFRDTLGDNSVSEVVVIETMERYNYSLTENHTDYFKSLFYELKDTLNKDDVDEEKYVSLVAKLFVADFYDLNSKLNKNDIGGVQFIYSNYRNTFSKYASDSTGIYYYVENNIYGDRKQLLPIVINVEIISIENIVFEYENLKADNAFKVKMKIIYEQDLGYDDDIEVILIGVDDKIEVVEMK